jgi:hypothetical protein
LQNAAREDVDEALGQLKEKIARRERNRRAQVKKIEDAQRVLEIPQDDLNRAYKDKDAEKVSTRRRWWSED